MNVSNIVSFEAEDQHFAHSISTLSVIFVILLCEYLTSLSSCGFHEDIYLQYLE